jgi:uncharacterized protein
MQEAVTRARARQIAPRDMSLDIPSDTPRYWMGGDPYSSHLMNVLSLLFPPGERFFMDAVRAFRHQVKDPHLLAQVRGFLAQEALHSREHKIFNRWLSRFGIDADEVEAAIAQEIVERRAKRTPIEDLAVTCALEHFTAIMAEAWLHETELREAAVEPLRSLWTWHAIEELDHKSVAYDVYHDIGGDYETRRRWMLRISVAFIVGVSIMHVRHMSRDGLFSRPGYVAKRWWAYWGPRGYFARLIPAYLKYYRRDFHPWAEDHTELIARFERELARTYQAA